MKLRMRHCAAIFLALGTIILANGVWLLVGSRWALVAIGLVIGACAIGVWLGRRRPDYHERRQLHRRLERWIDAHSCGDLLEVDGLFVSCCPHLIGPHVRLRAQYPLDRTTVPVHEYSLRHLAPGIRHSTMLGTINNHGELVLPQPTSLRAIIHKAPFEHDSGAVETTLAELEGLLDQLDRATPTLARS